MKLGTRIGLTAAAVSLAAGAALGATPSGPAIEFLVGQGPGMNTVLPIPGSSSPEISTLQHLSASPGGRMIAVARAALPGSTIGQGIWVRELGPRENWKLRVIAGLTPISRIPDGVVQDILAAPIVNDRREVLFVAAIVGQHPSTGALTSGTALLRSGADGTVDVMVRFGVTTGPGVPFGLDLLTPAVVYSSTDAWRFTDAGALYASGQTGLVGQCTFSGGGGPAMCMRTIVSRRPTTGGIAIPVASVQTPLAISSNGYSVQTLGSAIYGGTSNQLRGVIMFDPNGIGSLVVHDNATPVDGLPGQVILQTLSGESNWSLVAPNFLRPSVNRNCAIGFLAKFGAPAMNPSLGSGPVPTPSGPTGLFIKEPGRAARLIAESPLSTNSPATSRATPPGLPGWRFSSFSSPLVNSAGQVVFGANLTSPTSTQQPSIWLADPAGNLRLIALVSPTPVVGGPGGPGLAGPSCYASLGEPTINRRGQIMFLASVTAPVSPGSAVMRSAAVCAWDPTAGPSVLARSGQTVRLPTGVKSPLSLSDLSDLGGSLMVGSGNDDGAPTRLTDDGLVVFRSTVGPAGISALAVRIPTVTGACCAGATCLVGAALDCTGPAHRFTGASTVCASGAGVTSAGCCPADFNQDRSVGPDDLFGFIGAWLVADPMSDTSGDGATGTDDLIGFVRRYLLGC